MTSLLIGEPSHNGASLEEIEEGGERWYFSRKEIEENSPSRRDGIDLKKETHLRKSYCTFLQDLGMRLKVPQVTIATAIIFCHRFFLRQSHARNDRRTIATVCMFLAGKVEETPRPLKDVILISYEIINKKDQGAAQRIKQKEIYDQQKELILLGERAVLRTLAFDLNVYHPYKPLVEAIKKFKVAQKALAQVAWNFVNDGLKTSMCLQFKPHHIAAGAIFLAAKFLKVKLPSDGEKIWWQEFDVTPRQLEEVSNQMLELYEQNRVPLSQMSEAEESVLSNQQPPLKGLSSNPAPSRQVPDEQSAENHSGPPKTTQTRSKDSGSSENSTIPRDDEINDSKKLVVGNGEDDQEGNCVRIEPTESVEVKDKLHSRNVSKDVAVGRSPQDTVKKLDKEKLKAAFERRKARGDISRKVDPLDELERELEDVEVPERKQNLSKPSRTDQVSHGGNEDGCTHGHDFGTVEEGEVDVS